MSNNPYESSNDPGAPSPGALPTRRPKFTLVHLLLALSLVAVGIALLLPMGPRMARESARRTKCHNNLTIIALALANYQDAYGALPPAYTVDADGKLLHSWRTLILPFLEQKPLYDTIDLSKPWDDPANALAHGTDLDAYRCPTVVWATKNTTYLAVLSPQGCFRPTDGRKPADIIDDPKWTMMIVEVDSRYQVHWMSPTDTTEELILGLGTPDSRVHPSGFHALCVAGNVISLESGLNPDTLRALVSIAGNDDAVARKAN